MSECFARDGENRIDSGRSSNDMRSKIQGLRKALASWPIGEGDSVSRSLCSICGPSILVLRRTQSSTPKTERGCSQQSIILSEPVSLELLGRRLQRMSHVHERELRYELFNSG